jgi:hypothetical protein
MEKVSVRFDMADFGTHCNTTKRRRLYEKNKYFCNIHNCINAFSSFICSIYDKYNDPNTWDILLTNQTTDNRELQVRSPWDKKTKYQLGTADYSPTVEKVTPLIYKLTTATALPNGEYYLLTGGGKYPGLGYDFGIHN